jgi:hypothetical protein
MFSNIPQVTKNILILNGLFFLATFVLQNQGIDLIALFGAHYVNSPLFHQQYIREHISRKTARESDSTIYVCSPQ